MSALPRRVDARRLAAAGGALEGEVALAALSRLADALGTAQDQGTARLVLALVVGDQRRLTADGHLSARLRLQCQRCLAPMEWALDVPLALVLVAAEDAAAAAPRDRDPVLLASDGSLDPVALVEDELILALPVVARHNNGCPDGSPASLDSADPGAEGPRRSSPFAALRRGDE